MLFIVAMRHVGTARAGAYFPIAPFFGAVLAVFLDAPITLIPMIAARARHWGSGFTSPSAASTSKRRPTSHCERTLEGGSDAEFVPQADECLSQA